MKVERPHRDRAQELTESITALPLSIVTLYASTWRRVVFDAPRLVERRIGRRPELSAHSFATVSAGIAFFLCVWANRLPLEKSVTTIQEFHKSVVFWKVVLAVLSYLLGAAVFASAVRFVRAVVGRRYALPSSAVNVEQWALYYAGLVSVVSACALVAESADSDAVSQRARLIEYCAVFLSIPLVDALIAIRKKPVAGGVAAAAARPVGFNDAFAAALVAICACAAYWITSNTWLVAHDIMNYGRKPILDNGVFVGTLREGSVRHESGRGILLQLCNVVPAKAYWLSSTHQPSRRFLQDAIDKGEVCRQGAPCPDPPPLLVRVVGRVVRNPDYENEPELRVFEVLDSARNATCDTWPKDGQ